nr:MAG TPA: hypothetical protein [Caudoviricetes sp.]
MLIAMLYFYSLGFQQFTLFIEVYKIKPHYMRQLLL